MAVSARTETTDGRGVVETTTTKAPESGRGGLALRGMPGLQPPRLRGSAESAFRLGLRVSDSRAACQKRRAQSEFGLGLRVSDGRAATSSEELNRHLDSGRASATARRLPAATSRPREQKRASPPRMRIWAGYVTWLSAIKVRSIATRRLAATTSARAARHTRTPSTRSATSSHAPSARIPTRTRTCCLAGTSSASTAFSAPFGSATSARYAACPHRSGAS